MPQAWLTEPCCTNMSSPPAVTLVCANVPLVRELLLAAGVTADPSSPHLVLLESHLVAAAAKGVPLRPALLAGDARPELVAAPLPVLAPSPPAPPAPDWREAAKALAAHKEYAALTAGVRTRELNAAAADKFSTMGQQFSIAVNALIGLFTAAGTGYGMGQVLWGSATPSLIAALVVCVVLMLIEMYLLIMGLHRADVGSKVLEFVAPGFGAAQPPRLSPQRKKVQ